MKELDTLYETMNVWCQNSISLIEQEGKKDMECPICDKFTCKGENADCPCVEVLGRVCYKMPLYIRWKRLAFLIYIDACDNLPRFRKKTKAIQKRIYQMIKHYEVKNDI